MSATVRAYRAEDLGRILQLWERAGYVPLGPDGLTVDQAVDLMASGPEITLVAETDEGIVGMVAGAAIGAVGWIGRLAVAPEGAGVEVAHRLLDRLAARLVEEGARKLLTVLGEAHESHALFIRAGFKQVDALRCLQREIPATVAAPAALARLGGRMIEPALWDQLRGMEQAKVIIERRVILPLAEPQLAARHAVAPPRAIELILRLPSAVVFVDEVEDLASVRPQERRASPGVTNEFLKQIPRLRGAAHHLLVCATNWVGRLDPAFLRPGRFDYVLPVGPPDAEAREAIWKRYTEEITDQALDLRRLVAASELFTPADIEFAARKAAQMAFEREHFEGERHRATTAEFLAAIEQTKPTLSEEIVVDVGASTGSIRGARGGSGSAARSGWSAIGKLFSEAL